MDIIEDCKKKIFKQEGFHKSDNINYDRFLVVYQNSQELLLNNGITLDEKEFAQIILGITKLSYKSMKYANGNPKILKDYEVSDEDVNEVRKKIISDKKLHRKMMLTYNEISNYFNDSNYYLPLAEAEYFEKILDISNFCFKNIKSRPSKSTTSILESENINEDEILVFRAKVIKDANLHSGDSLTYTQCKELFERYYIVLSEEEFMQKVLDISLKSYNEAKYNNSRRVWILRQEHPSDKSIENLKNLIISTEKLRSGDSLDYQSIKSIFNNYYTPLSEIEFAKKILDVSEFSLRTVKSNGKKAIILKNLSLENETILEYRKKIIKEEHLCIGEKISYKRFKKIYDNNFFPLTEMEFAEKILDISPNNYNQIKYVAGRTTSILQNEKISLEEIKCIQEKILQEYKIGEWIDIDSFNHIYASFPIRLQKKDYAEQILHISKSKFKSMKSKGSRSKISFGQDEYTTELFKSLKNNGYYLGYKIDLEEFQSLYENFGTKATMRTFANVIGINYNILVKKLKQPILNTRLKKAKDNFMENIKDEPIKFHDIEEMQNFCTDNNLTFNEFIEHILSIYFYDKNLLKQLLEKKKGCWYGGKKIRCSHEFTEKYAKLIFNISKNISKSICSKYLLYDAIEEYSSEAALYIMEKCGDLEKNYEDSKDILFNRIKQRTRLAIKGKVICDNFKIKRISTTKYYSDTEDDLEIPDEKTNVENQAISSTSSFLTLQEDSTEKIIETILIEVENGYSIDETLEVLSSELNCNKNELMLIIRDYYIHNKNEFER